MRLAVKPAQVGQLLFIALAALAVYSFGATARDGEMRRVCTPLCAMQPNYANRNRVAPEFDLPTLNGERLKLSDLRGKVVILNFWTKTCRPCLEEMPALAQLSQLLTETGRKDIELVTVSTDETADDIRNTLKSVLGDKIPFKVAIDPEGKIVTDVYGTKLFPETWFIDKRGIIRARIDGARENWASALTIEFAESFGQPLACPVRFRAGRPSGRRAEICTELAP